MLRKALVVLWFTSAAFAADNPIDRWAAAVGGREKVGAVKTIYREATLRWGGYEGTLKAWHSAEGKYRKEERIEMFSSVEIFDGASASLQRNAAPPIALTGGDLRRARSSAYANFNAVFFALFPERRHGSVAVEDDGTIVLKPEGGIDWRITLDPQTSLPKTMTHKDGDKTITVTFVSYESVDGITLEKEIHRSNGDPAMDVVIRFNKTVFNPPLDASLFTLPAVEAPPKSSQILQKGSSRALDAGSVAGSYAGTLHDAGMELTGTWTPETFTFKRVAAK